MKVIEMVRVLLDESVGTRGALRNCRAELEHRVEAERTVEHLCRRIAVPERGVSSAHPTAPGGAGRRPA